MAMIECPECAAHISDKAKACIKCGAPITMAPATDSEDQLLMECTECAAHISATSKVCSNCGTPVQAPGAAKGDAVNPVVVTEQTGKQYKAAQLVGAVLLCVSVVSCTSHEPAATVTTGVAGLLAYIYGRFGAWWNHG